MAHMDFKMKMVAGVTSPNAIAGNIYVYLYCKSLDKQQMRCKLLIFFKIKNTVKQGKEGWKED